MTAASHRRTRRWRGLLIPLALSGLAATWGCSPSSLIDVQSPSTVVDPSLINNAAAAAELRTGALVRVMSAYGEDPHNSVIAMSGFLSDELSDTYRWSGATADDRNILNPSLSKNVSGYGYDDIQQARTKAQQAAQALQLYAQNTPSVPRAWEGEMYALEGYTVLWFAELYCSGIPLTSVPLSGAQVPTRGYTTEELFTRAVALFDSAAVTGADSATFVNLAMVGKARALLGLGQFAEADSAAQNVPTDFVYSLRSLTSSNDGWGIFYLPIYVAGEYYRVQDHEGGTGLVWSTDPRPGIVTVPGQTGDMLWPSKYNVTNGAFDPTTQPIGGAIRLADGLEARLIQAEAALAEGNGNWLTMLNTLRSTCIGTTPCAPVPGLTSASLPALTDPGTADARLDLVMQERAMWLYLTGHREGDLRRLAHVYNRDPNTLWPTGTMTGPAYPPDYPLPVPEAGQPYGPDMVYGPDVNEQVRNPLYAGCYDTNP